MPTETRKQNSRTGPAMDPMLAGFAKLLGAMAQQQQGTIAEMKRPVGRIAESPKNRPSWNIMDDPNYKPFGGSQYGAMGDNGQKVNSWRDNTAPAVGQTKPAATPVSGGGGQGPVQGFGQWDWLINSAVNAGGQPQPQANPAMTAPAAQGPYSSMEMDQLRNVISLFGPQAQQNQAPQYPITPTMQPPAQPAGSMPFGHTQQAPGFGQVPPQGNPNSARQALDQEILQSHSIQQTPVGNAADLWSSVFDTYRQKQQEPNAPFLYGTGDALWQGIKNTPKTPWDALSFMFGPTRKF